MVFGSGIIMNKAQGVLKLFENAKTFIMAIEAKDHDDAISKILKQVGSMEGAEIVAQKHDYIAFRDNQNRPVSELLGLVKMILEKDPRFRNEKDSPVGMFEVEKGKFIVFGRGEE